MSRKSVTRVELGAESSVRLNVRREGGVILGHLRHLETGPDGDLGLCVRGVGVREVLHPPTGLGEAGLLSEGQSVLLQADLYLTRAGNLTTDLVVAHAANVHWGRGDDLLAGVPLLLRHGGVLLGLVRLCGLAQRLKRGQHLPPDAARPGRGVTRAGCPAQGRVAGLASVAV